MSAPTQFDRGAAVLLHAPSVRPTVSCARGPPSSAPLQQIGIDEHPQVRGMPERRHATVGLPMLTGVCADRRLRTPAIAAESM